ncbi:MAG: helix-hairpin-helix domain-containing protein [Eubacterium sp.]|nr:helix-hairpin-helix domain-containing protein [Eubacterium sp.]
MKKIAIALILLCYAMLIVTGCSSSGEDLLLSEESTQSRKQDETQSDEIYVYICGAVKSPGVYPVKDGSRIYEVVELAGGLTKKAAADSVNLAEEVTDGQMVVVPSKEKSQAEVTDGSDNEDDKVNINTATKEELMTLSGIGEAKADAIIAYREENGSFRAVEDLVNVSGIAEGTLGKIKENIKVN